MQPGQGRFSSCTAAAPAQWPSSALPWLTETHGAAASINWALCSLRSQMPSPSSPHAERVLCVHNQPLGRSELGNKTPSLSPGRDWCPPGRGERWGQQVRASVRGVCKARLPGKPEGQRTRVASSGVPLAVPRCHPTWGHGTCPRSSFPGHPAPSRNWLRKDRE